MKNRIYEKIIDEKIIVIVRGIYSEKIFSLAKAYLAGGIHLMEMTLDQSSDANREKTYSLIQRLRREFDGKMYFGAGTVMTTEQVESAIASGAQFIISPNTDRHVIEMTKKLDAVSIPGAFTPTEISDAHMYGADIVKLFPANALGASYVKSIKAPLNHVPILATGGVTPENIGEYWDAGCSGFGVAGKLVYKNWIDEDEFCKISETAQKYVAAISDLNKDKK